MGKNVITADKKHISLSLKFVVVIGLTPGCCMYSKSGLKASQTGLYLKKKGDLHWTRKKIKNEPEPYCEGNITQLSLPYTNFMQISQASILY